jgi:hypothetical protein
MSGRNMENVMNEMFAGIVAPHRDRSKPAKGLLFAGGSQGMQFNGGNVIECAFVYPVFVGTKWQDNQTWVALPRTFSCS